MSNEEKVQQASIALETYRQGGEISYSQAVIGLLTGIMHLCRLYKVDFLECLIQAREQYQIQKGH